MSNKFIFYPISARLILLSLSLVLLSKRRVSAKNSFTLIQTNSSNKTEDVGYVPSIPQKQMNLNGSIERSERHLGIFQASSRAFVEQEFLRSTLKTVPSTSWNEEDKGTLSPSIGSITIQFKNVDNSGARMDISYTIENGPTNCKDCLVAIHKAKTCSSQKISRRKFLKSKNVNNPWRKKAGTIIVTDENGRGTLSFCASLGLIISILFYSKLKLTRVVRRILFGFCIYDCIYSVCAALSVAMLPKETSDYALGTLTSCDIQGFLQQLGGLGCIFYNLSLSVYYVAIMKFHMKEKEIIAKKLEFWIHFIPNSFAIMSSIFLYAKRQYAPLTNQHLCWVGTYPQGCLDDPEKMECIRGDNSTAYYAEFLLVIPFFVVYFFIFIIMHNKKEKRQMETSTEG
ncbi:hypothetical protein CTEN210_18297 [Chaetoceros tenuissimus]|uniref:G-protein coupled receptors family 2 profile 2 domain-containing protein n=1 Tax=Chaetoceros tenuissimus TaxID=426638 RepID=A0AAD3DEH7_9STRA|nr:hypothetical protein CTEN210_18297 [Chaetoceros tenuissimus]